MSDNKYNINKDRDRISSEEIAGLKNFESLMSSYRDIKKPLYQKPFFWIGSGLMAACIVIAILLIPSHQVTQKTAHLAPYINPPFKSLTVAFEEYQVNADSGGTILCKSGTRIIVPASAFVDSSGQPVTGKVTLKYQECKDIMECIASGIPMSYDSAGKKYDFQTAGMFNMQGLSANKLVYITTGKQIQVEMPSSESGNNFNLYKLDTVARNWKFLRKDKVMNQVIATDSQAPSRQNAPKDTIQEMIPEENVIIPENVVNPLSNQVAIEKPFKPREKNPDVQTFTLDVLPEQFPELASYKGVEFEVGKENQNFDKTSFNVEWTDINLTKGRKEGSYNLHLSKGQKKFSVIVYPVFDEQNYPGAKKIYDQKFKQYQEAIDKREKEQKVRIAEQKRQMEMQQKQIERQNKLAILSDKKAALKRGKELKQQIAGQKRQMALSDKEALDETQNDLSYWNTRRVFAISSFGIYNSDFPCQFNNPVSMKVSFSDAGGQKLQFTTPVFLVDRSRKFMHAYYHLDARELFSFDPADKNVLFSVLPGNKIAILKEEGFKKLAASNEQAVDIVMETPGQTFSTIYELRDFVLGKVKVRKNKNFQD
jgi:hypothetical protein